jgi:hypothetical protein
MAVKASWPGVSRKVTLRPSARHLIGADVLGDAAGLAGDHVGAADRVEQRGLAVVDVAHDGDDRRTRLQVSSASTSADVDVDVALADALDVVPELGDEQLGRVLVDGLGERDRHAHLEQRLHQVGAALGHAVGELLTVIASGTTTSRTCLARGRTAGGGAFPFRGRGAARPASGRGCRLRRKGRG